jgi:hypothetical protein
MQSKSFLSSIVGLTLLGFKLTNHFVSSILGHCDQAQIISDLARYLFFPHIRLRAWPELLCTSQIIVALLRFGRYETAATAIAEHPTIQIWLELLCLWFSLSLHHALSDLILE